MTFKDRIMQVIVSLQQLEITATANNLEHLYGSMMALTDLAEDLHKVDDLLARQTEEKDEKNGRDLERTDAGPA